VSGEPSESQRESALEVGGRAAVSGLREAQLREEQAGPAVGDAQHGEPGGVADLGQRFERDPGVLGDLPAERQERATIDQRIVGDRASALRAADVRSQRLLRPGRCA